MSKSDGNAYSQNIQPDSLECERCGEAPTIEIRPVIGVVATCGCNRCMKMEFSGRMPPEWEP